jgi:Xaa-Pro aminopeptidase
VFERETGLELVEGEQIAETARSIKSKEELVLMQASMDVCEAGVLSMHEALEPGITENGLWAKLHETNIRLGGFFRTTHKSMVQGMFDASD